MAYIIALVVLGAAGFGAYKIYTYNKTLINFYIEGLDKGFGFSDISALWKCALLNTLEEPNSLYISAQSLSKCITQIKAQAELAGGDQLQSLLSKLYTFRNKIAKEDDTQKALESTKQLVSGQALSVVLPGKGAFESVIVGNSDKIMILLPSVKGKCPVPSSDWLDKQINVYLWRTGDAQYVFDTTVSGVSMYVGKSALLLEQSTKLERTQKRNAVRAQCHIAAQFYILREYPEDYKKVETRQGYRCVLLDISETGALIKIGGKGTAGMILRLHFQVFDRLVIMFGEVKSVQYDEATNISKLHFQCTHIEKEMQNQVASFVFGILPEDERAVITAMQQIEEDEKRDKIARGQIQENADGTIINALGEVVSEEERVKEEEEELGITSEGDDLTAEDIIHKLDDDNALPDLEEL